MPLAQNDYFGLVNDIQQYMQNSSLSLSNEIPRFISNAQQSIALDLKSIEDRVTRDFTLEASQPTFPKPIDYKNLSTFYIFTADLVTPLVYNILTPLKSASLDYCYKYSPNQSILGQPKYIAEADVYNFFITPTPKQNYQARIIYYQLPLALSELTPTNTLTNNAYNLLLYRCLLEAIPYEKADERTKYDQLYADTLSKYQREEQMRKTSGFFTRSLQ
jgi:hypothetical protein